MRTLSPSRRARCTLLSRSVTCSHLMTGAPSRPHAEAGGEPDVVARRAHLDLVVAGSHGQALGSRIVMRERLRRGELEGDHPLLAGSEGQPLEAAQLLVHLRHL